MPINEGQIWLSHLVKMCMKCTFSMLNDKQEILILTYFYVGETGCMPRYMSLVLKIRMCISLVNECCTCYYPKGLAIAKIF